MRGYPACSLRAQTIRHFAERHSTLVKAFGQTATYAGCSVYIRFNQFSFLSFIVWLLNCYFILKTPLLYAFPLHTPPHTTVAVINNQPLTANHQTGGKAGRHRYCDRHCKNFRNYRPQAGSTPWDGRRPGTVRERIRPRRSRRSCGTASGSRRRASRPRPSRCSR